MERRLSSLRKVDRVGSFVRARRPSLHWLAQPPLRQFKNSRLLLSLRFPVFADEFFVYVFLSEGFAALTPRLFYSLRDSSFGRCEGAETLTP